MNDVQHKLLQLPKHNRHGSFGTQHNRHKDLSLIGVQLATLGYGQLRPEQLKGKHVWKLVRLWQTNGLSIGRQKNLMAVLRWWAERVNNRGAIEPDNAFYGIGRRSYAATVQKAQVLAAAVLAQVDNPYIHASLRLQAAFGLRMQECLLIRPHQADAGTHLHLQRTWCKGGRPRTIPLTTAEQRAALEEAKALVSPGNSLIPADTTLRHQKLVYYAWVEKVGLANLHGLRHGWTQARFEALAGYPAPLTGGPSRAAMTKDARANDTAARLQVSAELGHSRMQITKTYMG